MTKSTLPFFNLYKDYVMKKSTMLLITICLVSMPIGVFGQSQTTGTLNLRNAQPAAVSLTVPSTGVTSYTIQLPATIGQAGQTLTINSITGSTATLSWADATFWGLGGNAVTTGGTDAGEQYLGTSNAQDLVLAANASERIRIVGVPGPSQGYVGIGTETPKTTLDVAGTMTLSNSGGASELRFAEPAADGAEYTAFRAAAQTTNITYTLPTAAPMAGQVLTSDASGNLSWSSSTSKLLRGFYTPMAGQWEHNIIVPGDIEPGALILITIHNGPGTTIGFSVTNVDYVTNTITVETSTGLGLIDRIAYLVVNP